MEDNTLGPQVPAEVIPQELHGLSGSFDAQPGKGRHTSGADVGNLPESLPLGQVGEVDFYRGDGDGQ